MSSRWAVGWNRESCIPVTKFDARNLNFCWQLQTVLLLQISGGLAAAVRNFLATRKIWCLDADVTAAVCNKGLKEYDRVDSISFTSGIGVPRAPLSKPDDDHQLEKTDVTVHHVLEEIERTNRKRRNRQSRDLRRRQRHRARKKKARNLDDAFGGEARSDESDEQPNFDDSGNEARNRNSGTERTETLSPDPNTEAKLMQDRVARLALAASVSTLDGLTLRGARNTRRYCPTSTTKTAPSGYKATGDNCRLPDEESEDQGTSVFRAIRQLELPLLMVQSTEDALIGEPLPLVLEKTVCIASVGF